MFDMFTERYAIFLNQATAFVYIVVASVLLLGRRFFLDASHGDRPPWLALIAIGLFNGTGNTAQALGLPHTPGLTQSLLNLLNLPLVLLLAWAFLRKRPSAVASIGAALIVAGAACSALRSLWQSDSAAEPVEPLWYAIVLYLCAQMFFSGERVFEEHVFGSRRVDPLLMFWVTLVTQFCLGWALLPIQAVRALGGLDLAALPDVIADGVLCTLGRSSDAPGAPACSVANTAVFFAYVAVDFSCYLWGLVVIRRGGAGHAHPPEPGDEAAEGSRERPRVAGAATKSRCRLPLGAAERSVGCARGRSRSLWCRTASGSTGRATWSRGWYCSCHSSRWRARSCSPRPSGVCCSY